MKKRVSILGCGWVGKALAIKLVQKGYEVEGTTTSANKLDYLQSHGIIPFIIDIGNHDTDFSPFLDTDTLIISITSKNSADFKHLILEIKKSKVRKIVFISSTSVYPNTNGLITETSPLNNSILIEIEELFRSNPILETTILRFGGLFGYDRKPSNFFKNNKKIRNPEGYINFIHRDDCVQIIEKIIEKNIWNLTLNACADSHPKRRDFYNNEFKKSGKTAPTFDEESMNSYKIISNEKLKLKLDYTFKYADLMNY